MDRQWRAAHPDRADEKLERPPYGQRLAAAFLEMCRDALAGQPADPSTTTADGAPDGDAAPAPTKAPQRAEPEIMIVITKEKMFDDAEAAGICTTIDGVPLPVEMVRKLLVDAKIYPVVLGGDGEILDFGRARRFFTSAQKKAAAVRDLSCQFGDCDNTHPLRRLPPLHPLGRRRHHRHRQRSTHLQQLPRQIDQRRLPPPTIQRHHLHLRPQRPTHPPTQQPMERMNTRRVQWRRRAHGRASMQGVNM